MIPGWLDAIEEEVATCLRARGSMSVRELAESLGVSEAAALAYISLLVSSGRLTIDRVSLPSERREPGPASGFAHPIIAAGAAA